MIPLFAGICLLIALAGKAQLVDTTRSTPYLAVFSNPNAFNSVYLPVLEKGTPMRYPISSWRRWTTNSPVTGDSGKGTTITIHFKNRKLLNGHTD